MNNLSNSIARGRLRVGIVGTGYIADFHARAVRIRDDAELVAVADRNLDAAKAFGEVWGAPAFGSLADMAAAMQLDAVHILVPPDLHASLGVEALSAGLHVLVEKPMCVSEAEAIQLRDAERRSGKLLRVNHSMLFGASYAQLRSYIRSGEIGPLDYLIFNHFAELGFIRFGPFSNWMLREPGNVLLEIGSHPISGMIDLVGEPHTLEVTADRETQLPGGAYAYRRWRIRGTAGRTAVDINLDLGPGFPHRTIIARGALGTIIADLDADTCTIERRTRGGMDFDRYRRTVSNARALRKQARDTLSDYLLSKIKLRNRGNPYEKSILDSVAAFYDELNGGSLDNRVDSRTGEAVVNTCVSAAKIAKLKQASIQAPFVGKELRPSVLVIGGTGFIGKRLIEQLLAGGYSVRAAGRSTSQALQDLRADRLEVARADLRSSDDLERVLDGVEVVYHLATTDAKTWPEFVKKEVEPSRMLGEACLRRGISKLIYSGTIDSYYAGAKAGTITETTPLDPKIERRNNYARAKAAIERLLTEMAQDKGLPLIIARPGIVIGSGGNPFHWGIGSWLSEGVCEVWGDGTNKLPLVLVEDVARGLVRCMEASGTVGRSFNLIDAPLLSAREYLEELQRLTEMRIDIRYRSIASFYAEDFMKWIVKSAVGHPDAARRPSYHDWESRTQKAFFDCTRTRAELNWEPAFERGRLVEDGIKASLDSWIRARS